MREPLPSPPPSPPPPPPQLPHQEGCSAPPPNRGAGPDEDELPSSSPTSMLDASSASASAEADAVAHADPTHAATRGHVDATAPAFWSTRHARSTSYHSIAHVGPGPIQLVDHSEDQHEQSQACWARSVTVDDYTVVSGTSGIGAYVVWHCTVSTLEGGKMNIRKR